MKNITKNVLIIGNYGNYNIGDETLLKVVILELLDKEKDIKVWIPVRNIDFVDIYHKDISHILNPFYVYDIRTLIKCLLNSDRIIIGGGGIWSGYTGKLAKLIPIFLIISKIIGKRIIVKSVGLYNTASMIEKILVNLSFLLVDQCSVRDKESFDNIWKINKKVKIERDLALELPNILEKYGLYQKYDDFLKNILEYNIINNARSEGKRIIGISVKPLKQLDKTKDITDVFSNFVNTINSKYRDHIKLVFFPFSQTEVENDRILIDNIIKNAEFKRNIIIVSQMNPVIWYLLMGSVDIFIGMRFHSILFAHMNNKQFLAIPYENKVWNFVQDIKGANVLTLENLNERYLITYIENDIRTELHR